MNESSEPIPVENLPASAAISSDDARPRMEIPPAVRLIAVADVHLPAAVGLDKELDAFYVTLLGFFKDDAASGHRLYYAEKHRIVFDLKTPPVEHDGLRAIGIEVPSLWDVERQLIDTGYAYEKQRSTKIVGLLELLIQDPAGNWVSVSENRRVM